MAHYIDADKLIKSVNNYQEGAKAALNPIDGNADYYKGKIDACKDMQEFIISLQQEQPEVQNGKFVFPKYLYARTKDNKTIDMSYAPQDMAAVEYIRNDFVEQEQPVEGLEEFEKELHQYWLEQKQKGIIVDGSIDDYITVQEVARHFYELGRKAKEDK